MHSSTAAHHHISHQLTRIFSVVVGLQVDPALRIGTKERTQAQRGVHADAAQTFDDFIDAPGWHFYCFGQRIGSNSWVLKIFEQNNAGVRQRNLMGHGGSTSVVINNFNLLGMAVSADKTDSPLVVNANAVLGQLIATQRLQAIGGRYPQKA